MHERKTQNKQKQSEDYIKQKAQNLETEQIKDQLIKQDIERQFEQVKLQKLIFQKKKGPNLSPQYNNNNQYLQKKQTKLDYLDSKLEKEKKVKFSGFNLQKQLENINYKKKFNSDEGKTQTLLQHNNNNNNNNNKLSNIQYTRIQSNSQKFDSTTKKSQQIDQQIQYNNQKFQNPQINLKAPKEIIQQGFKIDNQKNNQLQIQNQSVLQQKFEYSGICVVDTSQKARQVINQINCLIEEYQQKNEQLIFACDTEVANINLKSTTSDSPVVRGDLICFSIYAGPQFDFKIQNQENFIQQNNSLDDLFQNNQNLNGQNQFNFSDLNVQNQIQDSFSQQNLNQVSDNQISLQQLNYDENLIVFNNSNLNDQNLNQISNFNSPEKRNYDKNLNEFKNFDLENQNSNQNQNYKKSIQKMDQMKESPNRNGIWVDVLNFENDAEKREILIQFADFLQNPNILKVWHNYSFDRHIFERNFQKLGKEFENFKVRGFFGDTMHMARVQNTSRFNYSLDDLSKDEKIMFPNGFLQNYNDKNSKNQFQKEIFEKNSISKLFGYKMKMKNGEFQKTSRIPNIEDLQNNDEEIRTKINECREKEKLPKYENLREEWIKYSVQDAKVTWHLYSALKFSLQKEFCNIDPCLISTNIKNNKQQLFQIQNQMYNMQDMYQKYIVKLGDILTQMESTGIFIDLDYLNQIQNQASNDQIRAWQIFQRWIYTRVPDAIFINLSSIPQLVQILFGGLNGEISNQHEKLVFKIPEKLPLTTLQIKPQNVKIQGIEIQPKKQYFLHNLWSKEKNQPPPFGFLPHELAKKGFKLEKFKIFENNYENKSNNNNQQQQFYTPTTSLEYLEPLAGNLSSAIEALKLIDPNNYLFEYLDENQQFDQQKLEQIREKFKDLVYLHQQEIHQQNSNSKQKQQFRENLQILKEKFKFGSLFLYMEDIKSGLEACVGFGQIIRFKQIGKLVGSFIQKLQTDQIRTNSNGRIHCNLNIGTDTGRLSSSNPNLQNQPAYEKDIYKIRKAFRAMPRNKFVVADYGQLELRVLAHITSCQSMIDAFEKGGDFHSRTAADMYEYIKGAIGRGEVLLEKGDWKGGEGDKMPPLVKERYASERRKAKILNFSLAYGKSAYGLAQDWGTSKKEAEETLEKWYSNRQEVRRWQEQQYEKGSQCGYVETMLGRRRHLPGMLYNARDSWEFRSDMRKAINTPMQGSAADIVTCAMIRLVEHEKLQKYGWKLLLQIHDEVILEGPEETSEEAEKIVVECMEKPFWNEAEKKFWNPMKVELKVDSKIVDNWYEGH